MVKRKSAESKEVFLSESEQADKQKKYFNRIQDVVTTCTIFKSLAQF